MAILHGSWLLEKEKSGLFIWGETWRKVGAIDTVKSGMSLQHPLAMTESELKIFLNSLQQSGKLNWQLPETADIQEKIKKTRRSPKTTPAAIPTENLSIQRQVRAIALPTQISADNATLIPQHSAAALEEPTKIEEIYLYPWQVEGYLLNPQAAFVFLQSLPLNSTELDSFVGSDLRFWSHIARWSLDLLARCKFLPALEPQPDGSAIAKWQPLLDSSTDTLRLATFAKQMPAACRIYQKKEEGRGEKEEGRGEAEIGEWALAVDLPVGAEDLVLGFLSSVVDCEVRSSARAALTAAGSTLDIKTVSPTREWLQALQQESGIVRAESAALEKLATKLTAWAAPLQNQLSQQNQFHTCFQLLPPSPGKVNWSLNYCLQAVDETDFLVDATTVWNNSVERLNYAGRTIELPQETLLSGLGLASKLYPLIEPSLQAQRPQSCQLNPLQAYEFIKSVAWRFADSGLGVVLPPSLTKADGWASRLGLSIKAEKTPPNPPLLRGGVGETNPPLVRGGKGGLGLQSLLSFKWELTIGGQRISKAEFDNLIALNSPLVEINGEWVELRATDVRAAQSFFASRKEQMTLSLEDALRLASGDSQMIEKLPVVNFEATGQLQELLNTLSDNQAVSAIATPATFRGQLRPYQALGAGWLAFLERWGLGACLADDMGCGKTIQLIAFLLHLQEQDALKAPTLLVCPTSVLGNWEREVKKFGPTLKVLLHYGDQRAKGKAFAAAIKGKDLIVTSYSLVFRDAKEIQSTKWQGLVLDEAQNIKNSEAKQSQAVRQIEASFRIALTGTPVENRLQELWSILEFLNPGYLGPRNFFQRRFAIPIEKYGDRESLHTLRSLVRPFILRRLKTDKEIIQDLPEKQEMTVFCSLASGQAALYQKIVEESIANLESAEGIQRRGMILALLVKLKQLCNHPALVKAEGKPKELSINSQESGKLQRLVEMLEEVVAQGDRALIFTQFAEWGKLLKPHLEKHLGREVLFLYGGIKQQQREEMIDRFQHDPQGPPIMILSLKAGGTGLNLTRATHVFHYDRWWNPAVENQATDRVFRIGQTRNVQVHKFVCTGTLEEKIHDMIESKKALAEQVVSAGENWLTELDTDQLRNLLILDRNAIIETEEE
ncbi:DEAD/DEAH box helicase [Microcoleus sp. PH2017_02_FOX_O_A]|uniref:DEAD/DEAH box helicase n=1 Tax=Microcoleus sp. PH2017_02_FOX_O_A TaxID=2798813 RepID=UPI001D6B65D9|nr:DEAD/DEAH box helicase [Microcoleus sp. PH2017_02_FOX_O_A]MCC3411809.1 DEAD/DEAH box helicase [Microcoleus sp. PH2017_02_FOX_O_A]